MVEATESLIVLCAAAALIGFLHTLLGPDHYLPFVAMSRAGGWSLNKTVLITLLCGIGHVVSSVALGLVGIGFGIAAFKLEAIENFRSDLAGWLMLAFGLVYLIYGLRRAIRNRPHTHWHTHGDGTVHAHEHTHTGAHVHVHARGVPCLSRRAGMGTDCGPPSRLSIADCGLRIGDWEFNRQSAIHNPQSTMTPWILFTLFVFGPCEPLIPVLMYPAAQGRMWEVGLVATVFGLATLATMTTVVAMAYLATGSLLLNRFERYNHALAGLVVLLCGAAVKVEL